MAKRSKKTPFSTGKIIWILFIMAAAIIVFIILGLFLLIIFTPTDTTTSHEPNTIKIFADEEPFNANNLKEVHIANVYVVNGYLYKEVIDSSRELELGILDKSLEEIKGKETLPLVFESQPGLIQAIEINSTDPNYIYAVADYLPLKTETKYTSYIKREILSGSNCSKLYDEIDTELQNANYCTVDSDCQTLPLGSMYIMFGCYHYININENATDFYERMNYYDAECGDIIDMCRESPEPVCRKGKCTEANKLCEFNNTDNCDSNCSSISDCKFICGVGCINKDEIFDPMGATFDCAPGTCICNVNTCAEGSP